VILQAVAWGGLAVAALYLIGRRSPAAQLLGWSLAAAWVFVTVGTNFGEQVLAGLNAILSQFANWMERLKGATS
jgi:hypothetical protein